VYLRSTFHFAISLCKETVQPTQDVKTGHLNKKHPTLYKRMTRVGGLQASLFSLYNLTWPVQPVDSRVSTVSIASPVVNAAVNANTRSMRHSLKRRGILPRSRHQLPNSRGEVGGVMEKRNVSGRETGDPAHSAKPDFSRGHLESTKLQIILALLCSINRHEMGRE